MPEIDRSGPAKYTHLIRAADDPDERITRHIARGAPGSSILWKDMAKVPVETWKEKIFQHMLDGERRTFNKITCEVAGHTADVCFEGPLDRALWELINEGKLLHTMTAPIYFWVPRRLR